jgi:serine/threonine protein kinase
MTEDCFGMSNELVGTPDWLVAELSRSFVMDRQQLEPLVNEFTQEDPFGDAATLADFLVRRNALSRFQADRVTEGEAKTLVMGPYLLSEPIGSGSMGTVFRAVGKADRQSYAVKVLPLRSLWNVRMARRQVRAFADLPPHPVIVPFVDVGTAGGKHYLVWPLVEGETLEALVARHGPLSWADSARLAQRIAEGLQICHSQSIFHGLVKPSNIMVDKDGTVRLLDFGIGAMLAENTDESLLDTMSTANATAGMLDSASPESILDPAKRSPAGDQYSLGCVLFFCLTGRYPFPEGNMIDKMMAHQTQVPPPIRSFQPSVPPELEGAVERLMQKIPEARYRHIDELIQDLLVVTEGPRSGTRSKLTAVDTPSAKPLDETTVAALAGLTAPDVGTQTPVPLLPTTPRPRSSAARSGQLQSPPTLPVPPESKSKWTMPLHPRGSAPIAPSKAETATETAPAKGSLFGRVLDKLAFWRPTRDTVNCSVLAPTILSAGETATLPLFAHSESPETIVAMGRTYFPTHELVGTSPLRREIPRGAQLTFHVALPGLTLEPPVQKFVWRGQVMPLPFTVQVPEDFRPGEITGVASVGEGSDIILNFEFHVIVAKK